MADRFGNPSSENGASTRQINATVVGSGAFVGEGNTVLRISENIFGTGQTFDMKINGTAISGVVFNTDSDTTMADIATELASNIYISTAVASGTGQDATIKVELVANTFANFTEIETTGGSLPLPAVSLDVLAGVYEIPAALVIDDIKSLRIDETGVGGITYIGYALPGSLNGNPVWRIEKVTVAGVITSIEYPELGGVASSQNLFEWDDRAGYTFS